MFHLYHTTPWRDPDLPLGYQFMYMSPASGLPYYLHDSSVPNHDLRTTLPEPGPCAEAGDYSPLKVRVAVTDRLGAGNSGHSWVRVQPNPSASDTLVDDALTTAVNTNASPGDILRATFAAAAHAAHTPCRPIQNTDPTATSPTIASTTSPTVAPAMCPHDCHGRGRCQRSVPACTGAAECGLVCLCDAGYFGESCERDEVIALTEGPVHAILDD